MDLFFIYSKTERALPFPLTSTETVFIELLFFLDHPFWLQLSSIGQNQPLWLMMSTWQLMHQVVPSSSFYISSVRADHSIPPLQTLGGCIWLSFDSFSSHWSKSYRFLLKMNSHKQTIVSCAIHQVSFSSLSVSLVLFMVTPGHRRLEEIKYWVQIQLNQVCSLF